MSTNSESPRRSERVGPHQLVGEPATASSSSSGAPSVPERAPSASTQQLGARAGALQQRDLGGASAGLRDLGEPPAAQGW